VVELLFDRRSPLQRNQVIYIFFLDTLFIYLFLSKVVYDFVFSKIW
jgi:hypothetical protein